MDDYRQIGLCLSASNEVHNRILYLIYNVLKIEGQSVLIRKAFMSDHCTVLPKAARNVHCCSVAKDSIDVIRKTPGTGKHWRFLNAIHITHC